MRIIFAVLICHSLGFAVQAEYDQSCHEPPQMEEQCGMYAHRIVKPMMAYFDQVNGIMHRNNEEIKGKIDQIDALQEQVIQFRVDMARCTSKDQTIKLLEKKDESNEELIKSLKQQIALTNSVHKQLIDFKENELENKNQKIRQLERQIAELNAKLISETQKVTNLEKQLQNQINITVSKEQKTFQLETEVSKTVDNLKKMQQQQECRNSIGTNSSVHSVTLSNNYTFEALVLDTSDIVCTGWTIIQQRIHGGVDFNRSWEEYKNGFGDFWDGDFFLGLEKVHRLTTEQPHELCIQMRKFDGTTLMARFEVFAISGENDGFRLSTLGAFSGNITDELSYNRYVQFSTYDRDNDQDFNRINHCTQKHHGGWWYNNCAYCNLNGKYFETEVKHTAESIFWGIPWVALKQVRMMIRPKSN